MNSLDELALRWLWSTSLTRRGLGTNQSMLFFFLVCFSLV